MKTKRYLIKQLTAAEAGNTNTNETYIRCPNNFDHQSFFQQNGVVENNVKVIRFHYGTHKWHDSQLAFCPLHQ